MEEKLRAWAASRRSEAGDPFHLHTAGRARLQEEVARCLGPASRPGPVTRFPWRSFWPRLAFGLGTAGLLLLALRQAFPVREDTVMEMARQETPTTPWSPPAVEDMVGDGMETGAVPLELAARGVVADSGAAPPPPKPEPPLMMQRYGLTPSATPVIRSAVPETRAEGLEPAPAPEVALAAREESRGGRAAAPRRVSSAPAPTLAAPADRIQRADAEQFVQTSPSASGAVADQDLAAMTALSAETAGSKGEAAAATGAGAGRPAEKSEEQPDWSGTFERPPASRRNLNAPPDRALRSFRVERRGDMLRFLDEDGSVYAGPIVAGRAGSGAPAVTSFVGSVLPPNGVGFRVRGTNLLSGKELVFQGVLVTGATVRIQGQAILGGRDRIVVDLVGSGLVREAAR